MMPTSTFRTQMVKIKKFLSTEINMSLGTPHPNNYFFLIICQRHKTVFKHYHFFIFADNLNNIMRIEFVIDSIYFQEDVDCPPVWFVLNNLRLNFGKCHCIRFFIVNKLILISYTLRNITLEFVSKINNFGVFLVIH